MPGDQWDIDHKVALINGGRNVESNLAPALRDAHRAKTADDVKVKSRVARMKAKHLGVWPKSKRPLRSRGFGASRKPNPEPETGDDQ